MINILWASKTGDSNAWYHIEPFKRSKSVKNIYVIRYRLPNRVSEGVSYHIFDSTSKIKELLGFIKGILLTLRENKVDVIVTFNPFPWGLISFVFSRIYKVPIVFGLIGGELDSSRTNAIFRRILLCVLRRSDVITVTGQSYLSQLYKLGFQDNAHIFPHLVDIEYLESAKNDTFASDIVTITSFRELKRTQDIIKALKLLCDRGVQLSLNVVGDGPEKEKCVNLVDDLGIAENVRFIGYVEDIRPFINNAKYYVQASSSEGLSLALLESFALNIIPITTKAGDESDIIQDNKTGFFVDIACPDQIADTIEMLENSQGFTQHIRKSIKRATAEIDIKNSNHNIEQILRKTGVI